MDKVNWIFVVLATCTFALFCFCRVNDCCKELEIQTDFEPEGNEAFKQLATDWDLDKTNQPDVKQQSMDIQEAYKMLNDAYDRPGLTSEDLAYLEQASDLVDPGNRCYSELFDFGPEIGFYRKLAATSEYFEQKIIPKSNNQLHIIMFYTDWCKDCKELAAAFKNLIDAFEPLGVQFATIDAAKEATVLGLTGVDQVPQMVIVQGGKTYVYRQHIYTPEELDGFIRKKLPSKIGQRINDDNVNDFLNGWSDNRVRALVLESRGITRLQYLLAAFGFQNRVAFGFVDLSNEKNTKMIVDRFNVDAKLDSLLLFNEDSKRAMASVSMAEIPTQVLDATISLNQYLSLPGLSSQEVLEDVCPKESLAVVLITKNAPQFDIAKGALRHIALESEHSLKQVRFAHIDKEKQVDFLNAISKGSPEDNLMQLVVIWRPDSSKIKYEWINGVKLDLNTTDFPNNSVINTAKEKINSTICKLLATSDAFTHEAAVQNLYDEHAPGFSSEWIAYALYHVNFLIEKLSGDLSIVALSLLLTTASMLGLEYVWMYFLKFLRAAEEILRGRGTERIYNMLYGPEPDLNLFELNALTYNALIRSPNPGCFTILMISNLESQPQVLPPYHRTAWPHRKNRNLLFAYLLANRGLSWISELLCLSLGITEQFPFNPRKCAGTVLAINGSKKYFCVFNAKHSECPQGNRRMIRIISQLMNKHHDPVIGNNPQTTESHLLDGLGDWLKGLLKGTTFKYHIGAWPDYLSP
ncbi:hypothetical protein ACLKA7_001679 [Drosophila subpalustris]